MKDLENNIKLIIEQSNSNKKMCKNCKSFMDGKCTFGCINERNGYGYKINTGKLTSPEYSCSNFESEYDFSEQTVHILEDVLKDIERVNVAEKNMKLLLDNKITESDFIDIMR